MIARTMKEMSTVAPVGMPCAQAEISARSREMFTSVMSSLTATWPFPLQSPTHGTGVDVAVSVGVAVTVGVRVDVVVCVGEVTSV